MARSSGETHTRSACQQWHPRAHCRVHRTTSRFPAHRN